MANSVGEKDGILETVKTVVYALLIAGLFRTLFFQPFWIPSGSMKDTLLVGDFLFVNKMAYGYSRYSCPFAICPISGRLFGKSPERGDVVVFRHPTAGVDYIKRVVGLPGDTIQVKNGVLFLNGQEAKQTPNGTFVEPFGAQGPMRSITRCANGAVGQGADCEKPRFTEVFPDGHSHSILNIADRPASGNGRFNPDNTNIYTVPAGHFFFMGDNRDNSVDSRFSPTQSNGVGYVSEEFLIGRADRVIFSSAGRWIVAFWTWRADRFFEKIV